MLEPQGEITVATLNNHAIIDRYLMALFLNLFQICLCSAEIFRISTEAEFELYLKCLGYSGKLMLALVCVAIRKHLL